MSREQWEDHELVAMTQQYSTTRDTNQYIAHLAYAEISRQCVNGRKWSKCVNCGNPYPMDNYTPSSEVCSEGCAESYLEYLLG